MNREELKSIFDALRNDPQHHLGLGDIRLTIAQQDAILDLFPFKDNPISPAEGARKVQWSGYGELGNISQKPPQPTAEGAEDDKAGLIKQIKDAEKLLSRKNTPNEVLTKEQFTAIIEDSVKDIWYGRRSMNPVKEQAELLVDKLYPLFDRAAINFSNPKTV